ncbi:Protein TRI1 [Cyberlindnera fabianii]|uniref:Protein TRI1 n=1 Tax=Cyberlindnera fabianii TaxID=36022 RepID=A0A1V2L8A2_CYBFA|nr:Protein TRI1 [Cyberlindnera fabianii]
MSDFDEDTYKPTIDAILSVADLEQVSVKRIRRALQELFVVDFEDNKQQINELILERYHKLMDEKEKQEERKKRKMEEEDARYAQQLAGEGSRSRRATSVTAQKPRKKRAPSAPGSNAISSMELNLSPKLQELLGAARLPRTQVVKQVWEYIKANDLQNPNDKREIICDEKLEPIFGKKTNMFTMNKALSEHLYKDDE